MTISANTLFHFTKSINNLISILKNEFKPHYSSEDPLSEFFYEEENNLEIPILGSPSPRFMPPVGWVVPMVCFCDLPLSLVKEHMNQYGEYALGMSKEWGIRMGLNPVIYLSKKSHLVFSLFDVEEKCDRKYFSEIEAYIKPYKVNGEERRYYDEREWRYVPKSEDDDKILFKLQVHSPPINLTKANEAVGEKYKLSFGPEDIKYILIKNESERLEIIEAIKDAKVKYEPDIVTVLTSKILSSKQILEDF